MQNSIALPIKSEIATTRAIARIFVLYMSGWREMPPHNFDAETIEEMMEATREDDSLHGYTTVWALASFFPEDWPPAVIDDFLKARTWQGSLLDS